MNKYKNNKHLPKSIEITSKSKIKYNLILAVISIIVFSFCYKLFYRQACHDNEYKGAYISDTGSHVKLAINRKGCSLLHPAIRKTGWFTAILLDSKPIPATSQKMKLYKIYSYNIAIAFLLSLSVCMSIILIYYFITITFPSSNPYFDMLISTSIVFINTLIINPYDLNFFVGACGPNVWHNPTLIFSKTFGLILFMLIITAYKKYKSQKNYTKELILISILSPLCMWAKPSFLLSFLPTVAIVYLYLFAKKKISLRFLLQTGGSLAIALIPFFAINNFVYTGKECQVIFAFGVVHNHYAKFMTGGILVGILRASAFPLYVAAVSLKKPVSFAFKLSFVNYLIAFLISLCLAESGERLLHGNFLWTYIIAIFFFYLFACTDFFFKNKYSSTVKLVGCVLFLLHLACGIIYFSKLSLGYPYF